MGLAALARPFIVCVLTDRSVDAAVATMRLARLDGADAYELNLPLLLDSSPERLRALFTSAARPVYTSCRRRAFLRVYGVDPDQLPLWDDAERMARQLAALQLGSVAIDMELDCFDPRPAPPLGTAESAQVAELPGPPFELTDDPGAVTCQQQIIATAHAAGGDVILSCHTGRPQRSTDLVRIAWVAAARGADLVKIVTPCPQMSDLLDLFEATARLRIELPIPFTLVGAAACGSLSRTIGPTMGSGWVLAQQTFVPGGFHEQPLVAQAREILRLIPWRY
jgi:hypothetical protein